MEKSKLVAAAKEHYLDNPFLPWIKEEAFVQGAEWLLSQPIVDRLTEEEREKIIGWYNKALQEKGDISTIDGAIKTTVSSVVMFCLSDIFGKEMFEK